MRVSVPLALLLLVSATVDADTPSSTSWPAAPFRAWVLAERVPVLVAPMRNATEIGVLQRGDSVEARACVPSCSDPHAWASLEPFGYVRMEGLRTGEMDTDSRARSPRTSFRYGRVVRNATLVYGRADPTAPRIATLRLDDELAFRADGPPTETEWLERVRGGFVRASDIRPLIPSAFEGEHDPSGPLAFVRRATTLRADDGTERPVEKYDRFTFIGYEARNVRIEGGTLRAGHVRVARPRLRPHGVGSEERWVHVNLREQVLTAYEGDRWVFATMVSSGRSEHPTRAGHYRVSWKSVHDDMHGPPGDPYTAEQVPFIMYFYKGIALHGAYWHDVFGTQASHGCVNMSVRDAAWLFSWSAPEVPEGWHALLPARSRVPSLAVIVERR